MDEVKQCRDCGQHKPLDQFNKRNTRGRTGYLSYCKACLSARWRKWAYEPLRKDAA